MDEFAVLHSQPATGPVGRRGKALLAAALAGVAGVAVWHSQSGVGAVEQVSDDVMLEARPCSFFWPSSFADQVKQGWGDQWIAALTFNTRFVKMSACNWVVPKKWYDEYAAQGLLPFSQKTSVVSDTAWPDAVNKAVKDGQLVQLETYTWLEGTWTSEPLHDWYRTVGATFRMQEFLGCWPQFDEVTLDTFKNPVGFTDKLGVVTEPMTAVPTFTSATLKKFVGIQVNKDSKDQAGKAITLDTLATTAMATWGGVKAKTLQAYVATDDATADFKLYVAKHTKKLPATAPQLPDLQVWLEFRLESGVVTETTAVKSKAATDAAATKVAMSDTVALAQADQLIGSFEVNSFKLSWMLNYLRRSAAQRAALTWCKDAYSNLDCSDRASFVKAWYRAASKIDDKFYKCANPLS